jgi:hypothetical protein
MLFEHKKEQVTVKLPSGIINYTSNHEDGWALD